MMSSALPPLNPFPGMNPYLEQRGLWPDVHNNIVQQLRTLLARQLRPEYRVSTEERVYVMMDPNGNGSGPTIGNGLRIPDVAVLAVGAGAGTDADTAAGGALRFAMPERSKDAIAVQLPATDLFKERYLEVRRVANREVVAIIELLSPTNKSRDGRREYLAKRAATLYSPAHLIEIDLLRAGPRMPVIGNVPDTDYRILVANARRTEPIADLYAFGIRQPIPDFVLPLAQDAEGIAVNLNAVVGQVYTDGSYDLEIDYRQDPEPPLSNADRAWLDALLREQGLRGPNADQEEQR